MEHNYYYGSNALIALCILIFESAKNNLGNKGHFENLSELLFLDSKYDFSDLKLLAIDSSITHIRPRFKLSAAYTPEEMIKRLRVMLQHPHPGLKGKVIDNHIILDIVEPELHYWSPHLNFRVEPDEEDPTKAYLMGIIGPRPAVWTMFMFIYFGAGLIGFIVSSYGFSKWMLGTYSWTLWAFPVAILFMLTAYQAGKFGERLGADQVDLLKDFIREAMRKEEKGVGTRE